MANVATATEALLGACQVGDFHRIHQWFRIHSVDRKTQFAALRTAVEYGQADVIDCLIDRYHFDINCTIDNNDSSIIGLTSLLVCAGIHNGASMVEHLLQRGADISRKTKELSTALHLACQEGARTKVVSDLLHFGAEVDCLDGQGCSPLLVACREEYFSLAHFLISCKQGQQYPHVVNTADQYGRTPIFYACRADNQKLVQDLLTHGANNVNALDRISGSTPLHVACCNGNHELVQILLEEADASVDVVDKTGATPLMGVLAAAGIGEATCLMVAQCLLEHGADINAMNLKKGGERPIHIATRRIRNRNKVAVLKFLCERNARVSNVPLELGITPLHLASIGGNVEMVRCLLAHHARADEATNAENGKATALHMAAKNGHTEICQCLIHDGGANVNCVDHSGKTPLYYACELETVNPRVCPTKIEETVTVLLTNGANVDLVEQVSGFTPLHVACKNGRLNIVKLLVEGGNPDLLIKTRQGTSSLACCCQTDDINLIFFLMQHHIAVSKLQADTIIRL